MRRIVAIYLPGIRAGLSGYWWPDYMTVRSISLVIETEDR